MAAYDGALADAGVHNYNLVPVSSIVPAEASIEPVGTAPDLGPPGNRLTVVEGKAVVAGPDRATAGLGWTIGDGPGVIYEAAGEFDEGTAERRIERGLAAARNLRDWTFTGERYRATTVTPEGGEFGAAVVIAAYGESEPIF